VIFFNDYGLIQAQVELFNNGMVTSFSFVMVPQETRDNDGNSFAAGVEDSSTISVSAVYPIPDAPFSIRYQWNRITSEWPASKCWNFWMPSILKWRVLLAGQGRAGVVKKL